MALSFDTWYTYTIIAKKKLAEKTSPVSFHGLSLFKELQKEEEFGGKIAKCGMGEGR